MENITITLPLLKSTLKEITSSGMFWLLAVLMLVDILLGKYNAILTKNYISSIGTKGLIKHSTIMLLSILVSFIFTITKQPSFIFIFKGFYILEYVTSIMEHLTLLGVNLPPLFIDRLGINKETYHEKVERSLRDHDNV